MKTIPPLLLADLKLQTTTLAFLWSITMANGRVIRGTEHDLDIVMPADGAHSPPQWPPAAAGTYFAIANVTAGDIVSNSDMSVDNLSVDGAMPQAPYTEILDVTVDEIEAGLLDMAPVAVYFCNWAAPSHGCFEIKSGFLGAHTRDSDGKYVTEVRGLSQLLAQIVIDTFSATCTVKKFGDARCKFNVASITITGDVVGGSSPPSSGAPPAALAAGYTERTFGPNVTLGSNVYPFNFFGYVQPSGSNVQNSDGSLTCVGNYSTVNAGVCTAYHTTVGSPPHNYVGFAAGGGAYFEAVLKFPARTGSVAGIGWPSFWAMAIEHLAGDFSDQWLGQSTGYVHFGEMDIMEFDDGVINKYGGVIHDHYGSPLAHVVAGPGAITVSADMSQYQTYGLLWIPATSTTRGSVTWYFNNVARGTYSWDQYNPATGPIPVSGTTALAVADVQHYPLILGSSNPTLPMTVQSMSVWQATGANNLPPSAPLPPPGPTGDTLSRKSFLVELAQASPLPPYSYVGGTLTFTSGANAGFSREVKLDPNTHAGIIELWDDFPEAIAPGDAFTLSPGCDRLYPTCKNIYFNLNNWRGYGVFIPGADAILAGPATVAGL